MGAVLNNAATQDTYTEALTLHAPRSTHLSLRVRNAAVYYQLGDGWGAVTWRDERFELPGSLERDLCFDAIRFRSAAAGVPASVTVAGETSDERSTSGEDGAGG